jgi:hypothetical protein
MVKAFTFFFNVNRNRAFRASSLQEFQVGAADCDKTTTNTEFFSDYDWTGFQPKDAFIKVDTVVQIGHCDSDVVHLVSGSRWFPEDCHVDTSRVTDNWCYSVDAQPERGTHHGSVDEYLV